MVDQGDLTVIDPIVYMSNYPQVLSAFYRLERTRDVDITNMHRTTKTNWNVLADYSRLCVYHRKRKEWAIGEEAARFTADPTKLGLGYAPQPPARKQTKKTEATSE